MTPEQFSQRLTRMNEQLKKAMDNDIPKIVANRATQMFKQNFREEGFFGKKWKEVQRRQTRTITLKSGKKKIVTVGKGVMGRRKILTGRTGALGRSIRWKVEPGKAIIYNDAKNKDNKEYASAHNEGTTNAGRSHNVHIPQRQFIGDHAKINEMVKKTIEERMGKILK